MKIAVTMIHFRWLLGGFVLLLSCSIHAEPECVVETGRVNGVRIGGPIDQALIAFQKGFEVLEEKPKQSLDPHVFRVREKSTQKVWITFAVNRKSKITMAYVEGPCATKEGIRVGSTLGQAIRVYGAAQLSPSDLGYYVGFKKIPRVSFLLDNKDVPKKLRGIPDDELKAKEEKKILTYRNAKIVEIKLTTEIVDD
jgi:hypothetical protein